ncbi:MAG: HNH endonuclease family protein [Actinobacteria bacterium]|nr:HNH endonuclease family protein [Actinomycetota bacterium]
MVRFDRTLSGVRSIRQRNHRTRTFPATPATSIEIERAAHVHRFGNLTLLTTSLNSKVSNGPWAKKRGQLALNDALLLNRRLLRSLGDTVR